MKKAIALIGILAITVISYAGELKYSKDMISGPYTHKNLTIFLIHGKSTIGSENILTLDEALSQKKIKIYETNDVDRLFVKNLSDKMHNGQLLLCCLQNFWEL